MNLADGSDKKEYKSEEEFHYPGALSEDRLSVSSSTDSTNRPGISLAPTDLTPQLSQAPDFRVPTREAPQTGLTPRHISPSPHTMLWEKDEIATKCRGCQRPFGLLIRKVCFPNSLVCTKLIYQRSMYASLGSFKETPLMYDCSIAENVVRFFATVALHLEPF